MRQSARQDKTGRLSSEDKQTLLQLARDTLQKYLDEGKQPLCESDSRALLQPRATFVTLRSRSSGDLRGCRGESFACRPLIESVARMAIASATDDPRFPSVTSEELPDILIEISALTPMKLIQPKDIVIGLHGLMISKGHRSGLLLPQLPTAYGWSREEFLRQLCRKAGLEENDWIAEDAELYAFESEIWGD